MKRLALLTEIPAPYRIPLFNALADRLDLTVLFLRERNPDRPYQLHDDEFLFAWRILRGRDVSLAGRWIVLSTGVRRALRETRPDVVLLGGWNQPAFLGALGWARLRRIPVLLWVESTGRDSRSHRLDALKRGLLRIVDGCVVPGSASHAHLRSLGVPGDRITVAPNSVDAKLFGGEDGRRPEGERCRVLGVGRLAYEKGFDVLLEAARDLPVEVVIAGSGPEERRLRALGGPNVRFVGQLDRDELPSLYAEADVLAAPSRSDPWGMALNEAALAGLPLVATDAVGAAHDLIEDGVNGFRVPVDDGGAVRSALQRLCDDEAFRTAAGARSRELAARFTPEAWADAVAGAVTKGRSR